MNRLNQMTTKIIELRSLIGGEIYNQVHLQIRSQIIANEKFFRLEDAWEQISEQIWDESSKFLNC